MSLKSETLKKILKSIGKNVDDHIEEFGKSAKYSYEKLNNATSKAQYYANKMNDASKHIFREITPEELENSFSPAEHLFKVKAKTSVNLMAFGGLTAYGVASGLSRESNVEGEIVPMHQYGMINPNTNPILDEEVQMQQRNENTMQRAIEKESRTYGSAGPEIVFALHELRNR